MSEQSNLVILMNFVIQGCSYEFCLVWLFPPLLYKIGDRASQPMTGRSDLVAKRERSGRRGRRTGYLSESEGLNYRLGLWLLFVGRLYPASPTDRRTAKKGFKKAIIDANEAIASVTARPFILADFNFKTQIDPKSVEIGFDREIVCLAPDQRETASSFRAEGASPALPLIGVLNLKPEVQTVQFQAAGEKAIIGANEAIASVRAKPKIA